MTCQNLEIHRFRLEREFLPLLEFHRIVELCRPTTEEWVQFPRGDLHRLRDLKFWREAFVADLFAQRTGQLNVELKLTPEGFAGDFVLRNTKGDHLYEVTEVLNEEERRRRSRLTGEERRRVQFVPQEELSGVLARRLIPERIAAKALNHGYTTATGLVVYVDMCTDIERNGLGGLLPAVNIPFNTVWLLADGEAYCIFDDG